MIPDSEAKVIFSRNLQSLLARRKMTIYRLAAESGLPQRRVYRAARGEMSPDVTTALAIAQFLGVSVESLFSESSEKTVDRSRSSR